MNPTDPNTWHNISQHPAFGGGDFDPLWYDGDVEGDLEKLRIVALAIIAALPEYACELVVLDDCTMYVQIYRFRSKIAAIYPTITDEGERAFFVDIAYRDEIRCKTIEEVVDILCEQRKPPIE